LQTCSLAGHTKHNTIFSEKSARFSSLYTPYLPGRVRSAYDAGLAAGCAAAFYVWFQSPGDERLGALKEHYNVENPWHVFSRICKYWCVSSARREYNVWRRPRGSRSARAWFWLFIWGVCFTGERSILCESC